jgi:hypothetical protein
MDGKGIRPPKGDVYFSVEGGNGEVGFYIVSDGTDKPYRLHLRAPCFHLVSALEQLIKSGKGTSLTLLTNGPHLITNPLRTLGFFYTSIAFFYGIDIINHPSTHTRPSCEATKTSPTGANGITTTSQIVPIT